MKTSSFCIGAVFIGTLLLSVWLVSGCSPRLPSKVDFHGLYTNNPRLTLMEFTRLEFLPNRRFEYSSDNECTFTASLGTGTYYVRRHKLVLKFDRHPQDQSKNYGVIRFPSARKDSIEFRCFLDTAFIKSQVDTLPVSMVAELRIPWADICTTAKSAAPEVAFKLPKSTAQEWGQLHINLFGAQHEAGRYKIHFPIVRDSSAILTINAMNPAGSEYFEPGDSLLLPIRRNFPNGYILGDLEKNRIRSGNPANHSNSAIIRNQP